MKKLTIALAVFLALALAAPAAASTNVKVGGSLETKLRLAPGQDLSASSDLKLNLGMDMGTGGKIRAFVGFSPISYSPFFSGIPNAPGASPQPLGGQTATSLNLPEVLTIKKAYLEAEGPYWLGGPELVTTLGDLTLDYSPYIMSKGAWEEGTGTQDINPANPSGPVVIGSPVDIEGAGLARVAIGPATFAGFYGWNPTTNRARGTMATATLPGVNLSGAIVRAGIDNEVAYAGSITFSPTERIDISGLYAMDVPRRAAVQKVDAIIKGLPVEVLPGLTLKLGYRNFDRNFNPIYRDRSWNTTANKPANVVDQNKGQRGVNAEVSSTLRGVDVKAAVDQYERRDIGGFIEGTKRTIDLGAGTAVEGFKLKGGAQLVSTNLPEVTDPEDRNVVTYTFGAEKDFQVENLAIKARYNLTVPSNDVITHEIEGSTVLDPLPSIKGVKVSGKYTLRGSSGDLTASAVYGAPNGMNLGLHYSTAEGPYATAGMKLEF